MSILGQADPAGAAGAAATRGTSQDVTGMFLVLTLLVAVAMWQCWRRGIFRKEAVLGPDRTSGPHVGWPVLVTLLLGGAAWVAVNAALATYRQAQWTKEGRAGQFDASSLTPGDLAFLSTVPGVVAIATIAVCLAMWRREQRPRLGVELGRMAEGVRRGGMALLVILPVVLWVSTVTEIVYKAIGYEHPAEHEMLKAMDESGMVRWALITGAVLVAPVVEELLFRGLFQTLLGWAFNNAALPRTESGERVAMTAGRAAVGRWFAILVASAVFAGIHPHWSVPPIFVLALCLGFVYERTGNLYATMTVHALFNGFETVIYLTGIAR